MLSVSLPLYLHIQSPYVGNGSDVLITLELCQLSDLVKTLSYCYIITTFWLSPKLMKPPKLGIDHNLEVSFDNPNLEFVQLLDL